MGCAWVGADCGVFCHAPGGPWASHDGRRLGSWWTMAETFQGNDGLRREKRLGDALDEQYLYSLISITTATLQLSNEHVPGLVL